MKQPKVIKNFGYAICKNCDGQFVKRKVNQLFCKTKCRTDHWLKEHPRVQVVLHKI